MLIVVIFVESVKGLRWPLMTRRAGRWRPDWKLAEWFSKLLCKNRRKLRYSVRGRETRGIPTGELRKVGVWGSKAYSERR